jgi:hypothetical protein
LKRQERLVRPGHALGHGPAPPNFRRDLVEHQTAVGFDPQEEAVGVSYHEMDEQYKLLVQRGIERGRDFMTLNKRVSLFIGKSL